MARLRNPVVAARNRESEREGCNDLEMKVQGTGSDQPIRYVYTAQESETGLALPG